MAVSGLPSAQKEAVMRAVEDLRRAEGEADARAAKIAAYFEATAGIAIAHLNDWERLLRYGDYLDSPEYRRSSFQRWLGLEPNYRPKQREFIPWLDIVDGDGYRREAAIRALGGGAPNAFLLVMLLRRLNDWVPEVRMAARERVLAVAIQTNPAAVASALWGVLPYLISWNRWKKRDRDILIDLLSIASVARELSNCLAEATAGPAATILGQIGRNPAIDSFLPMLAANAIQPAVRAKAYRSLLDNKMTWLEGYEWKWLRVQWCQKQRRAVLGERPLHSQVPFFDTIRKAAADPAVAVRRVAGDALIAQRDDLGAAALPIATRLAADVHPSVSERGQFVLKEMNREQSSCAEG